MRRSILRASHSYCGPILYEDTWPVIIEKMNLVDGCIDRLSLPELQTIYPSTTARSRLCINVTKIFVDAPVKTEGRLKAQYENLVYDQAAALPEFGLKQLY
jgi:hypothetical protein